MPEELDLTTQKTTTIGHLVEPMPEDIRKEIQAHLMVEFGFSTLAQEHLIKNKLVSQLKDGRTLGGRWNLMAAFYDNFQMPMQASTQGLNNPGTQ